MKAMILAAGVGKRMRPLTNQTPKPLLRVGGRPLIAHHLEHLSQAGFREVVINVSHLAEQIIEFCGDGGNWDLHIRHSIEPEPLETAGGIHRALPLLGTDPFLVINGDIWTDYPLMRLKNTTLKGKLTAHLILVDNPTQHPKGDFLLDKQGLIKELPEQASGLTYAGMGIYSRAFFAGVTAAKMPLKPLMDEAIRLGSLGGEYYAGSWHDVGTPERLRTLDRQFSS